MSQNQRNTCQRIWEIQKRSGRGWLEVSEERPSPTSSRPTKQFGGKAESLKWNSLECGWYVWHFWWRNFSFWTITICVSLLFTSARFHKLYFFLKTWKGFCVVFFVDRLYLIVGTKNLENNWSFWDKSKKHNGCCDNYNLCTLVLREITACADLCLEKHNIRAFCRKNHNILALAQNSIPFNSIWQKGVFNQFKRYMFTSQQNRQ